MSRRAFLVVGFAVALVMAGVLAFYASGAPDGLERAATDTGFAAAAEESVVADGPLADYQTAGVDDDRLSVGLAGVLGVAVTAALGFGLFRLLARRRPGD